MVVRTLLPGNRRGTADHHCEGTEPLDVRDQAARRAFPDPQGDGMATGPKRNFQVLSPLDFLAEFTPHIPPKGGASGPLLWLVLQR